MAQEEGKGNKIMKARCERNSRTISLLLIVGIVFFLNCGCTSMGCRNEDHRSWGRPSDNELRDSQRRMIWWGWPFGNSPAMEHQEAEEWRGTHY